MNFKIVTHKFCKTHVLLHFNLFLQYKWRIFMVIAHNIVKFQFISLQLYHSSWVWDNQSYEAVLIFIEFHPVLQRRPSTLITIVVFACEHAFLALSKGLYTQIVLVWVSLQILGLGLTDQSRSTKIEIIAKHDTIFLLLAFYLDVISW